VAKVIHNFGRADTVDREALARLVSSISRFLTPEQAAAVANADRQGLPARHDLAQRRRVETDSCSSSTAVHYNPDNLAWSSSLGTAARTSAKVPDETSMPSSRYRTRFA
jgi:hypothetical protein